MAEKIPDSKTLEKTNVDPECKEKMMEVHEDVVSPATSETDASSSASLLHTSSDCGGTSENPSSPSSEYRPESKISIRGIVELAFKKYKSPPKKDGSANPKKRKEKSPSILTKISSILRKGSDRKGESSVSQKPNTPEDALKRSVSPAGGMPEPLELHSGKSEQTNLTEVSIQVDPPSDFDYKSTGAIPKYSQLDPSMVARDMRKRIYGQVDEFLHGETNASIASSCEVESLTECSNVPHSSLDECKELNASLGSSRSCTSSLPESEEALELPATTISQPATFDETSPRTNVEESSDCVDVGQSLQRPLL